MDTATPSLEQARSKLREHAWGEAFDLLSGCDAATPLEAADLEGMAEAAWWIARLDDCLAARERAFALHEQNGDTCRAAYVAILLAKDNFAKGRASVGNAWFKRAERMLADMPDCPEAGHLERTRSVIAYEGAGDYEAALGHAERAMEIGMNLKDKDLIALALFDKGRSLAALGRVDEGFACMDEATIGAVSGELSPLATGFIYCNMISTCEELSDYRRAADWTEASHRWCERQAIAGFPGMCRIHRAGVIRLRGELAVAADEAERACREVLTFNRTYTGEAFYELGRIRFEMGALDEAEAAFRQAHQLGRDPQPGMAMLQLRRGKVHAAATSLARAVDQEKRDPFVTRLLPALVEAQLEAGDIEAAETAAERLDSIARTYQTSALAAETAACRARIALARNDAQDAIAHVRNALVIWQDLEIPYEIGRCRAILGRAYASLGDDEAAALELDTARSILHSIGAEGELTPSPAARPTARPGRSLRLRLRHEGEYWTFETGSKTLRLKDSKGMHHLAKLVQSPNVEIHALELVGPGLRTGAATGTTVADGLTTAANLGDAGDLLDPQAKAAYKARLQELREELEQSEEWGDTERAAQARREMEALMDQLAGAVGLGGRDRKAASASERARVNVTRAIRATLGRIGEHDAAVGAALDRAITTGTFCAYRPEPTLEIELDL